MGCKVFIRDHMKGVGGASEHQGSRKPKHIFPQSTSWVGPVLLSDPCCFVRGRGLLSSEGCACRQGCTLQMSSSAREVTAEAVCTPGSHRSMSCLERVEDPVGTLPCLPHCIAYSKSEEFILQPMPFFPPGRVSCMPLSDHQVLTSWAVA